MLRYAEIFRKLWQTLENLLSLESCCSCRCCAPVLNCPLRFTARCVHVPSLWYLVIITIMPPPQKKKKDVHALISGTCAHILWNMLGCSGKGELRWD